MKNKFARPSIDDLKNNLDFSQVPFSDRGSRVMVFLDVRGNDLYVKLAERLITLDPDIEAYLHRPALVQQLYFVDEFGSKLNFTYTSYPHAIHFTTEIGVFKLTFLDSETLAFGLPPDQKCGIYFRVAQKNWRNHDKGGEIKSFRNIIYTTNAEILGNEGLQRDEGYSVHFRLESSKNNSLLIHISNTPRMPSDVPSFDTIYETAKEKWEEWFNRVPPVEESLVEAYAYAWWVMANNLVSPKGYIRYEAMMPAKGKYVGLWLWDNAMHALAYRHIDPELARNQIKAMLAYQLPNGMLPDAIFDEGIVAEIDHPIHAAVTKPPILAWSALKLYKKAPDIEFLEYIYPRLARWNAWWFEQGDPDSYGLVQYTHPYSSGLDDNPLWDYGMPVVSPDINTYLAIQMKVLAEIAEILGREDEAIGWQEKSSNLVQRIIEELWDEEEGVFQAMYEGKPVPVMTPFNLFPFWTGQLPKLIQVRVLRHLTNKEEFWGENKLPSVAYNDPHHSPKTMWRGPVWVNVNYFMFEALRLIGEKALADELADSTLDLIRSQTGIFEYYNSQTGAPPVTAATAFGWTAAVYIELAIYASRNKK